MSPCKDSSFPKLGYGLRGVRTLRQSNAVLPTNAFRFFFESGELPEDQFNLAITHRGAIFEVPIDEVRITSLLSGDPSEGLIPLSEC